MKPRLLSTARLSFPLASALAALLVASSASAASLYWDTNGTITDSGAATGTWGTDTFWSTDPTGLIATANTTTTGLDDLFFSAGTTGTGGAVTLGANQVAKSLTFEEGAVSIGVVSGGNTLTLAGGGGITVLTGSGNSVLNANTIISGNNIFNVGAGRTLTVNSTTFTRSATGVRGTLNVQGAGTVAVTGGLATLSNDIIGPWASFGTTTGTTYATVSGGNITGLTYAGGADGTAVTTAANITSNTGAVNYSLSGTTAVATGAGASINTLRYTGAGVTISATNDLITKGIMNAGTGVLTFSNAVKSAASGNTTEVVVNTANNNITFNGILTGTITKTGSGTMTLSNVAHSIGGWTVNEGVLVTNNAGGDAFGSGTVNSGGTLRTAGGNSRFSNSAVFTVNAGGTWDMNAATDQIGGIVGAGSVINTAAGTANMHFNTTGSNTFSGVIGGGGGGGFGLIINGVGGTQTFTGLNTYTGVTDIRQGTLSINSIGNAVVGGPGVASAIGAPTTVANGTIKLGITTGTNLAQLTYTGTGHTTNRVIDLQGTSGGATINQSGASGQLEFTATAFTASGIGSKFLTLSGSTAGTGKIASSIVDNTTTGSTLSTAASSASTSLVLGSVDGLTVGNAISGTGIAGGTVIDAIDVATKTVTLSAVATVASGATITSTGLVNRTGVTKSGTGTWILSGTNTNTGATTISGGVLRIDGASSLGSGNLNMNGGILGLGAGDLTRALGSAANQVRFNSATANSGFAAFGADRTVNIGGSGATMQYGTSNFLSTGSLVLGHSTATHTTIFANNLNLAGGTRDITVNDGAAAVDARITGTIGVTGGTTGTLNKGGAGFLQLTGDNAFTGGMNITGGTMQLSGSSRFAGGSYAGAVALTNSAVFDKSSTGNQIMTGNITGATGTVKLDNANGQLLLRGAGNSFGTLNINAGRAFIQTNAGALPAAAAVNLTGGTLNFDLGASNTFNNLITVSSGANIAARSTTTLSNVVLPGSGTVIFNNDDVATTTLSIGGNKALTGNLTVQVGGNNTTVGAVTLGGNISGGFGLTKTQVGTLVLSGTNTYSGPTTITAGTLSVGQAANLGDAASNLVFDGGTLRVTGTILTSIGTLGRTNAVVFTAGKTVGLDVADASNTFTVGQVLDQTTGGFTKLGAGKAILDQTNTYTGATDVQGGTLAINGSVTTDVTVQSGATLGGSGTITGNVSVLAGGTFAAGNSIDSIAIVGDYTMTNANFGYELDANAAPGAEGDLTTVTGNLTLTGTNTLILTETSPFGNWALGSPLGDHLLGGAEKLTLIAYNGTWNGGLFTYLGNLVQDDSAILLNGQQWWFNYNDNDAGINFTGESAGFTSFVTITVPEPRAALLGGLGVLALLRRRRG